MNKTKIDWCDSTWNPVTGCLHGCEYCYAKKIITRFGSMTDNVRLDEIRQLLRIVLDYREGDDYKIEGECIELFRPIHSFEKKVPFPFGNRPTFHRYRLDDYKDKKGRTIFVCSMADLFGDWVPDEWIREVFKACEAAPQHRYLFLTKNPYRYAQLLLTGRLIGGENIWLGTTLAGKGKTPFNALDSKQNFISIEPLLEPVSDKFPFTNIQWVIIGAETGNRKGKVIPKREWIDAIVNQCRAVGVPVFMKESLRELMGKDFIQEFPWGAQP